VEYAVALTDGGYRFEIMLPWTTLLNGTDGTDAIGIALSIADDDDGGNVETVVSGMLGEGGPHSTDLWGTALLLE